MNILIRANSSSIIGTGHIMRCLVLAKKYKNDTITFATQDLQGNINQKILDKGYNLEILKTNSVPELDSLIKKLKIGMLIIDSYDISYNFEKKIKKLNKDLKLFVLDDNYKRHFCDILLNHNIYAKEKKYKNLVPKHCKLRCGSKYTLLRDEFKKAKKETNKKDEKRVLLLMGGADSKNLNIKILKILQKYNIKVELVTTNANKNLQNLKDFAKNKDFINLHINSNNIANLIVNSNFAITTPSVSANEIYYLKTPFIAIKIANNQQNMYKFLKKQGFYVMKKFSKTKLKTCIEKLLKGKI